MASASEFAYSIEITMVGANEIKSPLFHGKLHVKLQLELLCVLSAVFIPLDSDQSYLSIQSLLTDDIQQYISLQATKSQRAPRIYTSYIHSQHRTIFDQ